MLHSWHAKKNVILADEMGYFSFLASTLYLIVVQPWQDHPSLCAHLSAAPPVRPQPVSRHCPAVHLRSGSSVTRPHRSTWCGSGCARSRSGLRHSMSLHTWARRQLAKPSSTFPLDGVPRSSHHKRKNEFTKTANGLVPKTHVVVTSWQFIVSDLTFFKKFKWDCLVCC
jgi:hypothetical protein